MSQSIVCVAHHSVIERLSYWLLFNQDAVCSDQLNVTHETIANMLGVRRESITQALGKLQSAGLVSSGRGKIHIRDRDGLTGSVCECFALVSTETRRLYERLERSPEVAEAVCWPADESEGQDHALLHKYQDAYDFAPVGFVSLDQQGRVVQTNLAGAIMLGVQRSQPTQSPLVDFMVTSDRPLFLDFHQEVLSGKCRRHCEVTLCATAHRAEMVVRIDATLDEVGDECRLVMIDVTEEKNIAAQERAMERQQQEILATQPYMVWFKDAEGHLVSVNAKLIESWRHTEAAGQLERLDVRNMPWTLARPTPQHGARAER
jgi:PAS domain-containing protein